VNSNGSFKLGIPYQGLYCTEKVHATLGAAKVWGRREEEGIETAVFRRCTEVLGRNHRGFQQPAYACSCTPASFLAVEMQHGVIVRWDIFLWGKVLGCKSCVFGEEGDETW
jgi:hypothetical protein